MSSYRILLAGNPNVGKSTVFNALTGLKQHTGNWTGKTVGVAAGSFMLSGNRYQISDLPGTYSVISDSPEEKIARDYICRYKNSLILVVADATCLSRNLNLVLQLCEFSSNILLCINLLDEAERKNISVNIDVLRRELNIPVIGICARKKADIRRLKSAISSHCSDKRTASPPFQVKYPDIIEQAISQITQKIEAASLSEKDKRLVSLKLLDSPNFGATLASALINDNEKSDRLIGHAASIAEKLHTDGFPAVALRDLIAEALITNAVSITEKSITSVATKNKPPVCGFDKIITSKKFGIPLMIIFLCGILWLTICGANYPSKLLSDLFMYIKPFLYDFLTFIQAPLLIKKILINGVYETTAWVTSVMLPPMAIFFPLFTVLEDLGLLPRIAFNLDKHFYSAGTGGKQALTMCMGLGCNAVGVTGCRIISSPKERLAAIITNSLVPCNGKFGLLTTLSAVFIGGAFSQKRSSVVSAVFVFFLIFIGIAATLLITRILTGAILRTERTDFILELPPYRRPQLAKTLLRSILDRTVVILGRAITAAAPAGALIWIMANIYINNCSIFSHISDFLNPFAHLIGVDGTILLAFILALPANEVVLPIILMGYLKSGNMIDTDNISHLADILKSNGWTILTAVNVMLLSVFHFPCITTLKTIKKETGSMKWTLVSFAVPTICGLVVCIFTTAVWKIFMS